MREREREAVLSGDGITFVPKDQQARGKLKLKGEKWSHLYKRACDSFVCSYNLG